MIEYDLKKNNNKKNEKAYGKYYAKPHISETVDLDELADHMHGHNSPFSAGTIKGILIDAVTHIKELLLMGKNVKLDNLAIFYISIKNKMGAENADDFTVSKNIEGVRMKARATGDFRSVNLNLDANLKKYGAKKRSLRPPPTPKQLRHREIQARANLALPLTQAAVRKAMDLSNRDSISPLSLNGDCKSLNMFLNILTENDTRSISDDDWRRGGAQ